MTERAGNAGDRFKRYEASTRLLLPRRTYTIIRLDGKAFHNYLRHAKRPFDYVFMEDMQRVMAYLCGEITGTVFGYHQSDEISLLLQDFSSVHTEPWFGGGVQKLASVSAGMASAFLSIVRSECGIAVLDSRVFTIPEPVEVANYFRWRQQDCIRNSVTMAAQYYFPHKRLHQLSMAQRQELLWQEHKVNWNDYPDHAKRGSVCTRQVIGELDYVDVIAGEAVPVNEVRTGWVCEPAPEFTAVAGSWLAEKIPPLPSFEVPTDKPGILLSDGHLHDDDGGLHYGWKGHGSHAVHRHNTEGRTEWA